MAADSVTGMVSSLTPDHLHWCLHITHQCWLGGHFLSAQTHSAVLCSAGLGLGLGLC